MPSKAHPDDTRSRRAADHESRRRSGDRAPDAAHAGRPSLLPHPVLSMLAEVGYALEVCRSRLMASLKSVPARTDYGPYAARLKAAAARDPELQSLVRQAPQLGMPLREGLQGLEQVSEDLKRAHERLVEAGKALSSETPAAPAAAAPAAPPSASDWAGDLLRAVRQLAQAVNDGPPLTAVEDQRLWENVRDLHLEVVNLKGALSGAERRAPDRG